jgi:TRAP-type uncharacterized transport system fused permease subunit
MNELELIAVSAAAGAGLASTDAVSISRIAIEVARKKLGVPALAVYDQQAFVRQQKREHAESAEEGGE